MSEDHVHHHPLKRRKTRAEMTDRELAAEARYQEAYFRDLVSHLPEEEPPTRLSLWQRIKRSSLRAIDIFIQWFLIVALVTIIVKLFVALMSL